MAYETVQKSDPKDYKGMHQEQKKGKVFQKPGKPSRKTQAAVEKRTENYKKSGAGKQGYYAPGSQNPHKVRGK